VYHFSGRFSPGVLPRFSLFADHLRTVLVVKGSLRRAQQRRALDNSGPFWGPFLSREKSSVWNRSARHRLFVHFLAAADIGSAALHTAAQA